MIQRLLTVGLMTMLFATPTLAYRQICTDDTCHVGNVLPDFSPGSKPPRPWEGGGGSPYFDLTDYEPYRSADEGGFGVVLSTGGFQLTVTDLEIPGRGFPFQLSRSYRSKGDGERSVLGYNWHLSYDEYLTQGIYKDLTNTDRPALEWTMGNGWTNVWVDYQSDGNFVPFLGFFGKLRAMGTGHGFKIRYADGTVKTFDKPATVNSQSLWLLTRIEDRNGNFITLAYSGDRTVDTITDTLGRKITLTYDLITKRLTSVTNFRQRTVQYSYNAAGDLVSVRSPVVTATPDGIDDASKTTKTALRTQCSLRMTEVGVSTIGH